VFIESLSPRARAGLGLDYDRLSAGHPELVMMSTCLFGQHGPLSAYAGFGNVAAALVGFHELTGWPDRAPAGPFSAYTDYVSPRFAIPLLIQALDDRRRTGRGGYLDFAQAEAALHFLTPVLIEADLDGHVAGRLGNDDPVMAPHGAYPCAGDDTWVAVACRDDRDWHALAALLGRDDLASLGGDERLQRRRELDALVGGWTQRRDGGELEQVLVAAGIPAHRVQHSPECVADVQLAHRGHFVVVEHPHHGTVTVESSRVSLGATPSTLLRGAPVLGQHTLDVVTGLLGCDDVRLAELLEAGALE
jgi:benzylsuccinate CoA-transferase BbsF subunit